LNFTDIKQIYSQSVMPTYARQEICFVRGEGVYLWDTEGRRYLDLSSGIGVNSIGYSHPEWLKAVHDQACKLVHVSNLFYTEPGGILAQKLCVLSGLSSVFFANSGAEANEGLVKLARKYSADTYPGCRRHTIVTLLQSFHGRTHTTLAATGQESFHRHFQPLTPGFCHVPMGDIAALEILGDDICAVLLEPIQGEGGVIPLPKEYVKAVARLCKERDWLLLMDEVQTGIARCGTWFDFQNYDVIPDAVSFAKGIAGGLPLGGIIAGDKLRDTLGPGLHATTFGGTPLCCAAGLSVLNILEKELETIAERGGYFKDKLIEMNIPCIKETRGRGLMIAADIDADPKQAQEKLLSAGLVCLTAGSSAIRFLPPLVISKNELDQGLDIIQKVLYRL